MFVNSKILTVKKVSSRWQLTRVTHWPDEYSISRRDRQLLALCTSEPIASRLPPPASRTQHNLYSNRAVIYARIGGSVPN